MGVYKIEEASLDVCSIEGLEFDIEAHPVEDLAYDEKSRRIDAIIGALAMEKMGSNTKPENWRNRFNRFEEEGIRIPTLLTKYK